VTISDPAPQATEEGPLPASIQRIQRLERLERERLEDKARKEARRLGTIADAKPNDGRHDRVDRIERLTRIPVTLLGIAWAVCGVIIITSNAKGSASKGVVASFFALWVVLFVEYVVRLLVTPDTKGYVRRRWVEPATVVVPALQGWHLVGIEKMTLVIHEAALRIQAILRHHSLFRVLIAACGTVFLGAWLVQLFEEGQPHGGSGNIHTYPDALWWAIVTVTTVGYGDFFPKTAGGRVVACILMLVGIGLIGVLTATVASVFIKEHTDANKEEVKKGHEHINRQMLVIDARLADIEERLGAAPTDVAAEAASVEATVPPDTAANDTDVDST
jgi:voltage-gated potassium channel